MGDSTWFWLGLVAVFSIILLYVGVYNSESAYLQRAQQDGIKLDEINNKGLMYQKQEKHSEIQEQAEIMQKNLEKVAWDALRLDIKPWPDYQTYFPIRDTSDIEPHSDYEICNVGGNIPLHLNEISKVERFKLFAQKYSKYPMFLDIMDERRHNSQMHYGLSVTIPDGKSASTYFHVDTCTNQVLDDFRYILNCRNEETGYRNSANTKGDFMSSLEHDDFCIIPLSSWRQALYDYNQKISDIRHEIMMELEESNHTDETIMQFHKDSRQLDLLQNISYAYYSKDVEKAEKKIEQYSISYGTLPDDLLDIIERRPGK